MYNSIQGLLIVADASLSSNDKYMPNYFLILKHKGFEDVL